jgi:hypothetical protein
LNQNGERLFLPDIANDAAHRLASMLEDVATRWKLYHREVLPMVCRFNVSARHRKSLTSLRLCR